MSWAGCQNNPINLNFHLQKSMEIFEKNSDDKIWSNKHILGKSALSRARQGWYTDVIVFTHLGQVCFFGRKYFYCWG